MVDDFVDDGPSQDDLLDYGMETDATQHREARVEHESASEFGIDDRDDATRGIDADVDNPEQEGLENFGAGVSENTTLFDL